MGINPESYSPRAFGRHVRSLREVRRLTQEVLAERAGLSADTIRRLEQASFSPSLNTLRRLCTGLDISLSTLFMGFEFPERRHDGEVFDIIARMPLAQRGRLLELLIVAVKLLTAWERVDKELQ